ncbi:MAG: bifunctional serine/threonine-protein kinase/formylglycine-generating enzyme family protein [Gammaproteobacteria bacterium]|nr:bifunctional serine/threonine-protein kinase/formylglycine-generating enzyme family protein [Gammaproteobacteria bacterium]
MSDDDRTVLRDATGGASRETTAPHMLKERFLLEHEIGAGGMGTVYRAKDLRKVEARDRNPYVAVKVLNNEFREHRDAFVALQREASKSQALSHSNIVSIFDFDKDGDIPFMTMELLEGEELADVLRGCPSGVPRERAWRIIEDMCAGLTHAHEEGVVHADFKPGNVFVTHDGISKILDFGIAHAVQRADSSGEETVFDPLSLAALTPAYASKEMLIGEVPQPADDVFALGVVIYLVLTGVHPYNRERADKAAVEGMRLARPLGLTRSQWSALQWALSFDRKNRPASAGEFAERLLAPAFFRTPRFGATLVAATLLLGFAFWIGGFGRVEERRAVRQEALIGAQILRVSSLLQKPAFDELWERQIEDEIKRLEIMDRGGTITRAVRVKVSETYIERLQREPRFETAYVLLSRIKKNGGPRGVAKAEEYLHSMLVTPLLEAIASPRLDEAWLDEVELGLMRLEEVFGTNHELAELGLAAADSYRAVLDLGVGSDDMQFAKRVLLKYQKREFDAELILSAETALRETNARREAALAASREAERETERNEAFSNHLDGLVDAASCVRLDLEKLHHDMIAVLERYPERAEQAYTTVVEKLSGCVVEIGQLDPERAMAVKEEAIRRFGNHTSLAGVKIDPCAMEYLIGGGRSAGRGGFCADRVNGGSLGPRLVVIPEGDSVGRYAITKYELARSQFAQFCVETTKCSLEGEDRHPMTGVSVAVAREFAGWLSAQTGYTYRLPTRNEWNWAARGKTSEIDPNRNCRISLSGVERGLEVVASSSGAPNEFGMVNVLGNVQEWVVDGDLLMAVGGAFEDPLEDCQFELSRAHDGTADSITGFRLVREL